MELLIAILVALNVSVDPTLTKDQIKEKDPVNYNRAVRIIEKHLYRIEPTGIVIIDETGGKN